MKQILSTEILSLQIYSSITILPKLEILMLQSTSLIHSQPLKQELLTMPLLKFGTRSLIIIEAIFGLSVVSSMKWQCLNLPLEQILPIIYSKRLWLDSMKGYLCLIVKNSPILLLSWWLIIKKIDLKPKKY